MFGFFNRAPKAPQAEETPKRSGPELAAAAALAGAVALNAAGEAQAAPEAPSVDLTKVSGRAEGAGNAKIFTVGNKTFKIEGGNMVDVTGTAQAERKPIGASAANIVQPVKYESPVVKIDPVTGTVIKPLGQ